MAEGPLDGVAITVDQHAHATATQLHMHMLRIGFHIKPADGLVRQE